MSYMGLPCLSPPVDGIVINNDIMIIRFSEALATFVLGPPHACCITGTPTHYSYLHSTLYMNSLLLRPVSVLHLTWKV